jgi:hypothetical protein
MPVRLHQFDGGEHAPADAAHAWLRLSRLHAAYSGKANPFDIGQRHGIRPYAGHRFHDGRLAHRPQD